MCLVDLCPQCGADLGHIACVEGDEIVVRCPRHHVVRRECLGGEPFGHRALTAMMRKMERDEFHLDPRLT